MVDLMGIARPLAIRPSGAPGSLTRSANRIG